MKLVEIFESIQGEGRNVGRQVVFVRFAGCNLACPWCDTSHQTRFEATVDEIVTEIKRYHSKSVILTGGEPTIQLEMPELIAALKREGYWIGVETNATNEPDWFQFVDYIACSPKAEFADSVVLKRADEVRVVASSEDILDFCREMRHKISATDYYISPCERHGEIDYASAKALLSQLPDWSLSVQLHKILGFR